MKLPHILISIVLLTTTLSVSAFNDCGDCNKPWLVRVRSIGVAPKGSSDELKQFGNARLDNFSNAIGGELDFSYNYTECLVAEFSLATSRHSIEATGGTIVGTGRVSFVMASATMNYHFMSFGRFDPYVGLGFNYSFDYDRDDCPVDRVSYGDSVGLVGQIGVDVCLCDRWSLNFDLKKIYMDSEVHVEKNGTSDKACVRLNPWIFGVGIGYRF